MTKSDKIWGLGAFLFLFATLWIFGEDMEMGEKTITTIVTLVLAARLGHEFWGEKTAKKDAPI